MALAFAKQLTMEEVEELRDAAETLYMAGRWELPAPANPETCARMWERLRDALGLEPGGSA